MFEEEEEKRIYFKKKKGKQKKTFSIHIIRIAFKRKLHDQHAFLILIVIKNL